MSGRYEVVEEAAGAGGYGKIAKASDRRLERFVAIKTLDPLFKIGPSPEDKKRFWREARTLAALSHPNIPAIYDIEGAPEGEEFSIIFEWIEGLTVREFLQQSGPISLDDAKRWFGNICSALDHAHNRGVLHRDLKPSNLMLTSDRESCYLVDFGLALRSTDLDRLTGGSPVGTPGYMSPEHERGEELNAASDIYVLAIVLYECLSGIRPVVGNFVPLNHHNEAIPPAVDELILSCLKERPQDRLQQASEFHNRLREALLPHASFAKIIGDGSLHEIRNALAEMDPTSFRDLPSGQRRLIQGKINDLVEKDAAHLKNAIASLLTQLVRVAHSSDPQAYHLFVMYALRYGYEIKYNDAYQGNPAIREALNEVAKEYGQEAHSIVSKHVIDLLNRTEKLEPREKWFHGDIRRLLERLLANPHCADESADLL
jgi:serine/threonine protein kinase